MLKYGRDLLENQNTICKHNFKKSVSEDRKITIRISIFKKGETRKLLRNSLIMRTVEIRTIRMINGKTLTQVDKNGQPRFAKNAKNQHQHLRNKRFKNLTVSQPNERKQKFDNLNLGWKNRRQIAQCQLTLSFSPDPYILVNIGVYRLLFHSFHHEQIQWQDAQWHLQYIGRCHLNPSRRSQNVTLAPFQQVPILRPLSPLGHQMAESYKSLGNKTILYSLISAEW